MVVKWSAFYSGDPSSNCAEVHNFSGKSLLKISKERCRGRLAQICHFFLLISIKLFNAMANSFSSISPNVLSINDVNAEKICLFAGLTSSQNGEKICTATTRPKMLSDLNLFEHFRSLGQFNKRR